MSGRFYEIYLLICLNTCVCLKTFWLLLKMFNILFSTLFSVCQTWRLDWQSLTWKSKMVLLETFILKEHFVLHLAFSFVKLCHIRLKVSTKKWIVKSPLCQTANIQCQSLSKQPVSLGHISPNHRTIWSGVLWEWTSPTSRNSTKSTDTFWAANSWCINSLAPEKSYRKTLQFLMELSMIPSLLFSNSREILSHCTTVVRYSVLSRSLIRIDILIEEW